jgi:hypothetical protein
MSERRANTKVFGRRLWQEKENSFSFLKTQMTAKVALLLCMTERM